MSNSHTLNSYISPMDEDEREIARDFLIGACIMAGMWLAMMLFVFGIAYEWLPIW